MTIIDDRNDGTPADAQFSGGIHLQMQALVEALEEMIQMAEGSTAYNLSGTAQARVARARFLLSSVRCLKP